jgi:hypothetical protein
MKELWDFLDTHPWFKTLNIKLLEQRLFNYFVIRSNAIPAEELTHGFLFDLVAERVGDNAIARIHPRDIDPREDDFNHDGNSDP